MAEGIGVTGGIITGAALIMVAVFGAFALSSVMVIKSLGFAMALAVLIDATDRARHPRARLHAGHGLAQLVGATLDAARRRPAGSLRGRARAGHDPGAGSPPDRFV